MENLKFSKFRHFPNIRIPLFVRILTRRRLQIRRKRQKIAASYDQRSRQLCHLRVYILYKTVQNSLFFIISRNPSSEFGIWPAVTEEHPFGNFMPRSTFHYLKDTDPNQYYFIINLLLLTIVSGFFDMRPDPVLRDNLMLDRQLFWANLTSTYDEFNLVRDFHEDTFKPKNDF